MTETTASRYLREGYGVGEARFLYAQLDSPCRLLPAGCRLGDEKVAVHNLELRKALRVMRTFGERETALAFQPGGALIAVARQARGDGREVEILVRETRSGKLASRLHALLTNVRLARFSPDGQRLLIVQWISGGLAKCVLWNHRTNDVIDLQGYQYLSPSTAAFSPDGQRVAVGGLYGDVQLWDTQSGKSLAYWQGS